MSFDSVTESKTIVRCKCCKSMENKHSKKKKKKNRHPQFIPWTSDFRASIHDAQKREKEPEAGRRRGGERVAIFLLFLNKENQW